jgi:hypothetical protein
MEASMDHVVRHHTLDDAEHPVLHWIAAICLAILAITAFFFAFGSTDTAAAVESGLALQETVKNPDESGPARITHDNPKSAPTTGTDVKERGNKCRMITLRRDDGGLTKIRKCAE